jgi:hypothetical protein
MATYSQSRANGNTSDDATFRTLGSFISASLDSAGWAKTADTGQINWTTVVRAAVNTAAGYEIRTSPTKTGFEQVYVKLEYGQGSNVAYTSLWITLGYASDGAGTLTGTIGTRQVVAGVTSANYACTDRVSAGDDWFAIAQAIPAAGYINAGPTFLAIERLNDADGNPQTTGWNILGSRYQASFGQANNADGPSTAVSTLPMGYVPPGYSGSAGTVFVGVLMPQNGSACYPMRAACTIAATNTGTTSISFALYPGKTQTWITGGISVDAARCNTTIPANVVVHMRWE